MFPQKLRDLATISAREKEAGLDCRDRETAEKHFDLLADQFRADRLDFGNDARAFPPPRR